VTVTTEAADASIDGLVAALVEAFASKPPPADEGAVAEHAPEPAG
jgi:hypothetical protein